MLNFTNSEKNTPKQQVIFANQLRVLAFLSVVISHWLGVFWGARDQISYYIGGLPVEGNSTFLNVLQPPLTNFNYGPFGVAIFFLVSGFVIPFSLKNRSKVGFLIGRFFRIFPAYWLASIITIVVLYLTRIYFFQSENIVDINTPIVISNMFLVHNLLGYPSIDWVNWTLAIEIKFYLFCFIFYALIKKNHVFYIFFLTTLLYLFIFFTPIQNIAIPLQVIGIHGISVDALKHDLLFVPYMFIGTLFYYSYLNVISSKKLLLCSVSIFTTFFYMWEYSPLKGQYPVVTINYFYAFVLFYLCFLLRDKFKPNKIIDFLADQTFTFYILHSIIGYCLLKIFNTIGMRYSFSLIITFSVVLIMAVILNKTIEKWAINQGKKYK